MGHLPRFSLDICPQDCKKAHCPSFLGYSSSGNFFGESDASCTMDASCWKSKDPRSYLSRKLRLHKTAFFNPETWEMSCIDILPFPCFFSEL